jgi:KDO2-lipid IV(A) lauroyltransferase
MRFIVAASWILAWLPRPLNLALGDFAGWLYYILSPRRRGIALDNIEQAKANGFLNADIKTRQVAVGSFKNMGRTVFESFCLMHRGFGYFNNLVKINAAHYIQDLIAMATKKGHGIIFISSHTGNWELASAAFHEKYNLSISVVGRSQGWLLNEILNKIRTKGGGTFIFKNGGARAMLGLLNGGGFLGTLFDQAHFAGPGGAKLTFMGRPALTTLGPLKLSCRTGTPVVPLFCFRDGQKHILETYPPIFPPVDRFDKSWQLSTAQKLNDMLEDFIRLHPEQWMWNHRRWKIKDKER